MVSYLNGRERGLVGAYPIVEGACDLTSEDEAAGDGDVVQCCAGWGLVVDVDPDGLEGSDG